MARRRLSRLPTLPVTPHSPRDPGSPGSLFFTQLVKALVDRALNASEAEINRAHAGTGRIELALEIDVVNGKARWHNASVHFREHRMYERESPLG